MPLYELRDAIAGSNCRRTAKEQDLDQRSNDDEKDRNQEDEDQKCERRSGLFRCFAANSV
jgi:hypothetical protein